jgi:single-strand DNA-binding protein
MASLNRCAFIGNVTHNPELRRIASGNAVVDFSIAVNEKFTTKDGERREDTQFLDFTAWGKQAETIAQYVTKGQSMYVEAKVKNDKWDDKTTGEKRSKIKFEVLGYQFLGGGGKSSGEKPTSNVSQSATSVAPSNTDDEIDEEDIPF